MTDAQMQLTAAKAILEAIDMDDEETAAAALKIIRKLLEVKAS